MELTEEQREIADNLAGWKNILQDEDATVETEERASARIFELETELEDMGLNPDHVVVWSSDRGTWTVA
jgi:hypothetical protein